jgi:nucleolar protein 14
LYHDGGDASAGGSDDSSDYYSDSDDEESSSDKGEEDLSEGIDEDEEKQEEKQAEAKATTRKDKRGKDATTAQQQNGKKKAASGSDRFDELPYVIPIPKSYKEFANLVEGFKPKQTVEILQRIRISSPVSLGPANRKSMQVFFGIMIQFFVNQCKRTPLPTDTIDALVPEIHTLASEVPLYAATVARARLDQMHKTVLKGVWPSKQMLGTLQLFTELFDAQQPRHPVLTPMLLVISKWLLFTPIRSGEEMAKGLYLVKVLLRHIEQSKVLVPECLQFLNSITKRVKVDSAEPGLLALPAKTKAIEKSLKKAVTVEDILQVESGSGGTDGNSSSLSVEIFDTVSFKISALTYVYESLEDLFETYRSLPSASEMFEPIVDRMGTLADAFAASSYSKQGKALQKHAKRLEKGLEESIASRASLGNSFKEPVKAVRQFNPRFEEDFVAGKDYDIDRDRSERKRLRRELKRESRGAMRELRKDNKFLTSVKNREENQTKDAVQNKYNQMFHFLQQQESDFRSGGQKGTKFKNKKI